MTVGELIAALEDLDEDVPVRIFLDQFMPMEYQLRSVVNLDAMPADPQDPTAGETLPVVALVTGEQVGYAAHAAAVEAGCTFGQW